MNPSLSKENIPTEKALGVFPSSSPTDAAEKKGSPLPPPLISPFLSFGPRIKCQRPSHKAFSPKTQREKEQPISPRVGKVEKQKKRRGIFIFPLNVPSTFLFLFFFLEKHWLCVGLSGPPLPLLPKWFWVPGQRPPRTMKWAVPIRKPSWVEGESAPFVFPFPSTPRNFKRDSEKKENQCYFFQKSF